MKLFIAEKPDIGKTLANYLWPNGYTKEKGYLTNGDTTVTWAYGHILRLATPEEYSSDYKAWNNYPIIPQKWLLKPSANTAEQLSVIKKLLTSADMVFHAGDPDREGQLLIDEILYYLDYKGPVKRLLINAKDDISLKRAFENIRENSDFRNLYLAGLGRSRADWLVGMNLSRVYTVCARKYGYTNTFRIGRVKIPTLALVVNRENEIKNFKSEKFYELEATFTKDKLPFKVKWLPNDKYLDEQNKIKDEKILQAIKLKISNQPAIVQKIITKELMQNSPLPYSLDTLQVEANKKYNLSPKQVLDTVQSLYEKKFVSYPRSDCNYIPQSQKQDAAKILPMLAELNDFAGKADLSITSKAFNDKKITAHHAIIPTVVKPNNLTQDEQNIYNMIATRYIIQFFKPCLIDETSFNIKIADEHFTGGGKIIKSLGFRIVEKQNQENDILPHLHQGEEIQSGEYHILEKRTVPPKRFTEGTLLAAMANIYRYVDKDNPNREKLKEIKGIGTPATRDSIIQELELNSLKGNPIEPCIKKEKKELIPTKFGIDLIKNIDQSLTYPDTTANMEYALSEIAEGKKELQAFIDSIIEMVYKNIQYAENKKFPISRSSNGIICPICQQGEIVRKYSPKMKKYFHVCNNPNCVSPITNRKIYYEDDNGKPIIVNCPKCKNILVRIIGKKGPFWLCAKCNKIYNDKNGKPVIK